MITHLQCRYFPNPLTPIAKQPAAICNQPSRVSAWRLFVCSGKDRQLYVRAIAARTFAGLVCAVVFSVRRIPQSLILAVLVASGCGQKPAPVSDFAAQRQRM